MEKTLPHELFDGRTKLLPCQKEQMPLIRDRYKISYKKLADHYSISTTQAFYICNPEAERRKNIKGCKEAKKFYNKDAHRERRARCRGRKKQINMIFNI